MGQKLYFRPVRDADGVSATANVGGFTPLTSAARFYGWQARKITEAAEQCNRKRSAISVAGLRPKLLLLPQTDGKWNRHESARLARELIDLFVLEQSKLVHFTHYGFVQRSLAFDEVIAVLEQFADASTSAVVTKLVIDVDERVRGDFEKCAEKAGLRLTPA